MYRVLAGLIGALTALMIALNGGLAQHIGPYAASSFIHLTGLLLIALVLRIVRATPRSMQSLRPFLLSGGALGFVTVVGANVGVVRLGVSVTLALGLLAQTVASLVKLGWLGTPVRRFERRTLASLALIVLGIVVMASS